MGDGQIDPEKLKSRDQRFQVSTQQISQRRQKLFGLPEPYVSMPESTDFIGRQWTDEGPDSPAARRKERDGGK
jgi:hypothetical protein